jgi:GT2 family glycosyltransferase
MKAGACIALVNFNGHDDTIECLESVFKSSELNFQIIIVDNSRDPLSLEKICFWLENRGSYPIRSEFPELIYPLAPDRVSHKVYSEQEFEALSEAPTEKVLLVHAKNNSGFAGGNNIIMRYFLRCSKFEFVWLLNNDTIIKPDTLENLVRFAKNSNSKVGIIGAKLFNYYQSNQLQAVGANYYKWIGKVKEIGSGDLDRGQWDDKKFRFDYVIGASMFVKREFVESVGFLTEDYFLYFEELDWSIRGAKKNWEMSFCSNAIVYHKLGASTKSTRKTISEISDFYFVRNRIIIALRHFPFTIITLYLAFSLFIIKRIIMRKPERIKTLFRLIINPWQHYKALK